MNRIKDLWKRCLTWPSRLSAPKPLLLVLAVLGIAVTGLWLISSAWQPELVYLTSRGLSDSELSRAVAILKQGNHHYRIDGSYILVESTKKDELLARMDMSSLCSESDTAAYEATVKGSGIFLSETERRRRYRLSREAALASQIRGFRGLRLARVFLSSPGQPGFAGERGGSTATVTVWTEADQPLEPELAQAIRQTVAGSVADLSPQAVHVIDASSGLYVPADWPGLDGSSLTDQAAATAYLPLLRRRADRMAAEWEQRILRNINYIPGLLVAVHVNPRSLLARSDGGSNAPAETSVVASAPDRAQPDICVSISIPRTYLAGLYAGGRGTAAQPSDTDLQPIATQQIEKLTATASAIIGRPASGYVQVDWYHDQPPVLGTLTSTPPTTEISTARWPLSYWLRPANLALAGAAMFLGVGLFMVVRRVGLFRHRQRSIALSRVQAKHHYLDFDSAQRSLAQPSEPVEPAEYHGPDGPEFSAFEELVELDEATIRGLLGRTEPQTVALALRTAPPKLRHKILANLSGRRRQAVHDHPDFLGPARLSDIEAAQQELVDLLDVPDHSSAELVAAAGEPVA